MLTVIFKQIIPVSRAARALPAILPVLARCVAAYGSRERWLARTGLQTIFRDAWPVWWQRRLMMPWNRQNERIRLSTLHGTDSARVDFLEGDWTGQSWALSCRRVRVWR